MTADKNQQNDSWDFTIEKEKIPAEEIVQETSKERKLNLKLEDQKIDPSKTRNAMYEELESKFKDVEEDIVDYAPLSLRACAFFIDLSVYMTTYLLSNFTVPVTKWFFSIPMKRYHFSWTLSPLEVYYLMLGINLFILINLLLVIPPAFFGTTLGKRVAGLKIRGDKQFSIKYRTVFVREILLKPISLVVVIGVLLPFFNKKRKALHDIICKTLVIND